MSLDASVDPVALPASGLLDVPDDVHRLGWWNGSAQAGSPTGTVVLDGHVDGHGVRGALWVLARSHPGDLIVVTTPAGDLRYRITEVYTVGKRHLDQGYFAPGGPARLVLITCGGPFDRSSGHYLDNTVAVAVPA